jgi:hypothetical protein
MVLNLDFEIRLDRTTLACVKRFPPNQNSEGSGLRLSWPNASDGRRAVVGKSPSYAPSHRNRARHFSDVHIVHVSHGDVEMHYHFASSVPNGEPTHPVCLSVVRRNRP